MAEAAASIRSSHRFPYTLVPELGGSTENAFLSWLIRLWSSLDLVLSCFGLRAFCVMELFRGRYLVGRGTGGRVDERPGGERAREDGSSSRGVEVFPNENSPSPISCGSTAKRAFCLFLDSGSDKAS